MGVIWAADQESDIRFWYYGGVQQDAVGDRDLNSLSYPHLP